MAACADRGARLAGATMALAFAFAACSSEGSDTSRGGLGVARNDQPAGSPGGSTPFLTDASRVLTDASRDAVVAQPTGPSNDAATEKNPIDAPSANDAESAPTLQSVTPCSARGVDAPCLERGALCWNEPGELAPCADVYDPICTCMQGPCECWGMFGMQGPPYPNSPATVCEGASDSTTCLLPDALCWSVHADVADPCSNYAVPKCDCDDSPCRCWAPPRDRD